jgi:hypothetical protein
MVMMMCWCRSVSRLQNMAPTDSDKFGSSALAFHKIITLSSSGTSPLLIPLLFINSSGSIKQ